MLVWVPPEADPQPGRLKAVDLEGGSLDTLVEEGESEAAHGMLSGK